MAMNGHFDAIAQGCNCFCRQRSGIAKQMVEAFGTDDPEYYTLEHPKRYGDITKLGTIQWVGNEIQDGKGGYFHFDVINCYTQYKIAKFNDKDYEYTTEEIPIDYHAVTLCMRKINHIFAGKRIGLPQIGTGKAKGFWDIIKFIIRKELKDCNVTVVIYKP